MATQQKTLPDMFQEISKELLDRDKMISETGYLLASVHEVLDLMRDERNKLDLNMFIQKEENGYESSFDVMMGSKVTFVRTERLLKNLELVIKSRDFEITSLEDALIKFAFHGLRISEHDKCKENECLLYCVNCCKDPVYPSKGRGKIKTGLIINKKDYKAKENIKEWLSTKRVMKYHFYDNNGHFFKLDCNKERFEDLEHQCQYNQFSKVLRMAKSNQADAQYPYEIAHMHKSGVKVGNIGHGKDHCKKLRHHLALSMCLFILYLCQQ